MFVNMQSWYTDCMCMWESSRARLEWIYLSFDVATHTQQLAHNLQHQTRTTPRLMLSIHNHPTLRGENGRCAMLLSIYIVLYNTPHSHQVRNNSLRSLYFPGKFADWSSSNEAGLLHTAHTLQLERVDTWTQNNLGDFKQSTLNISAYLNHWWYE